jgi:hypothetical protein
MIQMKDSKKLKDEKFKFRKSENNKMIINMHRQLK